MMGELQDARRGAGTAGHPAVRLQQAVFRICRHPKVASLSPRQVGQEGSVPFRNGTDGGRGRR
jgi:hypothetical protein